MFKRGCRGGAVLRQLIGSLVADLKCHEKALRELAIPFYAVIPNSGISVAQLAFNFWAVTDSIGRP